MERKGKKHKLEHVIVKPWTMGEVCTLLHVPHDRAFIATRLCWEDLDAS